VVDPSHHYYHIFIWGSQSEPDPCAEVARGANGVGSLRSIGHAALPYLTLAWILGDFLDMAARAQLRPPRANPEQQQQQQQRQRRYTLNHKP